MEINPNLEELNSIQFTINSILLDYFKESIKDINSYDELPNWGKRIISEETFKYLTKQL